jgi:hypothetical protein
MNNSKLSFAKRYIEQECKRTDYRDGYNDGINNRPCQIGRSTHEYVTGLHEGREERRNGRKS